MYKGDNEYVSWHTNYVNINGQLQESPNEFV